MPDKMGWDEAARLAAILRADPSSAITAACEGWDHPISREALVLVDLFDLTHMANADPKRGRPKPHYLRPWKMRDRKKIGNAGGRSRVEVLAILSAARSGSYEWSAYAPDGGGGSED